MWVFLNEMKERSKEIHSPGIELQIEHDPVAK